MGQLVVPLEATQTSATIWVGVTGEPPPGLELEVGEAGRRPLPDAAWTRRVAHGVPAFAAQRMEVGGLQAGLQRPVRLLQNGTPIAQATATTLPDRLPGLDAASLVMLMASCFAHERDAGAASATAAAMPFGARPQVSFLCGDQVYLDAPFPRFLLNEYGDADLDAVHLQTYLSSWGLMGGSGLGALLTNGATFFSSDDHEYWNNAPERGWVVRNTWSATGREKWRTLALALYDLFQASGPVMTVDVPPLSIRTIDTRRSRTADQEWFMPPDQLADLRQWVDGLKGPGALVVGQVVFASPVGWKGRFLDWGLPDFRQYEEFVRTLMRSQHDLLVLTGDVHFGRISGCTLPSGASLVEIVSSPLALVDEHAGGTWTAPPGMFPAFGIAGTTQRPIWNVAEYEVTGNHMATLELNAIGNRIRLVVRSWPIVSSGMSPATSRTWTRDLT